MTLSNDIPPERGIEQIQGDAQDRIKQVRSNVAIVRERIAGAGGDPDAVVLVAVTKGFGPEVARTAISAGLRDLGENYAQELLGKVEATDAPISSSPTEHPRWHFLGRLQTNKVRLIAPHVALWQSVDRAELIREIAKRARGASILIQINLSGEPQKGGCTFEEVPALAESARAAGLDLRGLMGVGSAGDPRLAGSAFGRLVILAEHLELPVRSIGMSGDLEIAVGEGATMVRVGRDLFGDRPPR